MQNFITRCFAAVAILLCTSAYAAFDRIVLFGDSLSDNGNLYSFTLHYMPSNPPYYQGRFSNGPTWVEHVARSMHVELEDNAYGGATAKQDFNDIASQLTKYTANMSRDANVGSHLYVIWIGANDYLPNDETHEKATDTAITSIRSQIDKLVEHGAKNLLLFNLPDLGETPLARLVGPEYAHSETQKAQLHNQKLARLVSEEQAKHKDVKFILFDVTSYFHDAMLHPEKYGISNTTEPCYEGDTYMFRVLDDPRFDEYKSRVSNTGVIKYCGDADKHLFWDHVHPTRIVHEHIAQAVLKKIAESN